jgi:RNA polymerase sigma-70 factor, ECF subfamily
MKRPAADIPLSMSVPSEPIAAPAVPVRGPSLAPDEFSVRFRDATRTLWLIAAGVLGDRNDAEDVLQEAAMIGLRKLSEFDPATSFTAWMGGIVRNVARNDARKRARRHTAPADPATLDRSAAPEAPATGGGFDDRLLRALGMLEETARMCLLLRTVSNMQYKEIAAVLGIPEGTAMSHVHRSRQTLRGALTDQKGQTTP